MSAIVFAVSSARVASAQSSDSETLISEGIALRREHKNTEALDLFRKAFAIAPGPRIQAHVGLAEQAVGRWIEAERDIRASLEADGDPWIAKNRGALEQALGVVVGHLGWIEVRTDVANPEVYVNGARQTVVSGDPIRVVTGTNVVELRAQGYLPAMRTVLVLSNTRMTESFNLSALPATSSSAAEPLAAPPVPSPRPPERPTSAGEAVSSGGAEMSDARDGERRAGAPPLAYAALGLGAAGLAVGSVTGILSLSRASSAKRNCTGNACSPAARDDIDASMSLATVSDVSFVVGGVGVAAGALLWFLRPRERAGARAPTGVSEVGPFLGPRFVGLMGHF